MKGIGVVFMFLQTKNYDLFFLQVSLLKEPVVAYGPFVMNTEEEIRQAYRDYHEGKFGTAN